MKILKVFNVGPIKNIELNLNKFNVFMGPQGSGKSTIAKIISNCSWVEKNVSINQSINEYSNNKDFFINKLISFHKLNGYFNESSEIEYESDVIYFKYSYNDFDIRWKDRYAYKREKVSYIPSERNLVILPEIDKVELPNNNLRSFLFDWLDSRKKFSKKSSLKVLDLNFEYYFSDNDKENHVLTMPELNDIQLSDASSGLQSLIPMLTTLEYLTSIFYENDAIMSFELDEIRRKTSRKLLFEFIIQKKYPEKKMSDILDEREINELNRIISEDGSLINEYHRIMKNLFETSSSNLIIEEPEQNLFPATQKAFVYNLINKVTNSEYNHSVTLTTHSPYILYALNNCIMYSLVNSKLSDNDIDLISCSTTKISPSTISIYEIKDGHISSIQNKDSLIEENYFDSIMNGIMDNFYRMLNYYD